MITCQRCDDQAKEYNLKPRKFDKNELWHYPGDKEGTSRCPDCGNIDQKDARSYMRTKFNEDSE